jgi:hypothetical protein
VTLRGPGDRDDPRFLCEQPGQRDLRRRRLPTFGKRRQPIDEREISLPVLRGEARELVAEVRLLEGRGLVDLAGEKPSSEGAEGHEPDAHLLERRKDLLLGLSPPERVLALQNGDRLHGVGAADGRHGGLRHAEVPDLALRNQVPDGSGDILDGNARIDTMLIEEIDPICLEPPERGLGNLSNVGRATVDAGHLFALLDFEAELGREDDLVPDRRQGFADQLFVRERTVDFGGVEEGDSCVHGRPEDRDPLRPTRAAAVAGIEAHAAKAQSRDLQTALAECALLHASLR